ncbi:MAG: hypothetical protein V2B18_24035, partial [Pseudomonadota bacterium]
MPLTVRDVISRLTVPALRNIRTALGLPKALSAKDELVDALTSQMLRNINHVLSRVSVADARLISELAHNGGHFPADAFRAKYVGMRPADPRHFSAGEAPVAGLFFTRDEARYFMPPSLVPTLKELVPKPQAVRIEAVDSLPSELRHKNQTPRPIHVHKGSEIGLTELRGVLGSARTGKLKVTPRNRRPTGATEKAIQGVLVGSDFDLELPPEVSEEYGREFAAGSVRAHAWAVLVQQCGWCRPQNDKLVLTEAGAAVLASGRPSDFRTGVFKMLDDDDFDEMNRVNHIKGQTGRAKRHTTKPSLRRKALFLSLRAWPVGKWVTVPEALRFCIASGHGFQTCRSSFDLYFSSHDYGYLVDDESIDLQYLRVFLFETLGSLGLVDLAYVFPHFLWPEFDGLWGTDELPFCGRYDGLLYVRLNELGAYCLSLTETFQPASSADRDDLRILPNHDIVLTNPHPSASILTHML